MASAAAGLQVHQAAPGVRTGVGRPQRGAGAQALHTGHQRARDQLHALGLQRAPRRLALARRRAVQHVPACARRPSPGRALTHTP